MLKVVNQKQTDEYLIRDFKVSSLIAIVESAPFNPITIWQVEGYDVQQKTYVRLGLYRDFTEASTVCAQAIHRSHTWFVGGPYYNIYQMPLSDLPYIVVFPKSNFITQDDKYIQTADNFIFSGRMN